MGNYTVTVKGSDTVNYNEIAPNNETELEVKPTTVSIKNITVKKVVYGKNRTVDVIGSVNNNMANLGNYTGDIYINVMDYNIANRGKVQDDGSFTVNLKLDNTILPVNNYSLLVTLLGDENYRINSEIFKNILSVIPDNVTVEISNTNISYGFADSVIVEGRVLNDGFGVNWTGQVNVTIGDYKYDLINVHDGKFQIIVDNVKSYKAGNYTITVKDASGNENYTFNQESFTFENIFMINKVEASVNLNIITLTYGDAPWIELTGNITNPVSGLKYTGRINVTIKNYKYSNLEVIDGVLRINITDIAEYDAGNYTVSIIEADSENYTFKEFIFENMLIINKRTIELYNISVEPIQYGIVDAAYVTGNVNTTGYGDDYDGMIMVSINGIRKPALTVEGKFNLRFEGVGRFDVGNYTVTVEGYDTINYNRIAPNNDTKLEVKPATVSIKNVTVEKVVYGKNRTVEVIGVIDNLDHIINYTGRVYVYDLMGNSNSANVSGNGSFTVPISIGLLPVNSYSLFITVLGNNNYKTSTQKFTNALSVVPDNVTVTVDDINVSYGMSSSVTVDGSVLNDGFGVNWTGKVNVTIGDIEYNNIPVIDGKFQFPINMTYYNVGNYNITVTDASGNENYTFKNETFKFEDKLIVNKSKVTVNINNITITYGDCEFVELKGNITNPPYGIKYNGEINIIIGNHEYDNIEVVNGGFEHIIDIAEYDAGNYTIVILEAEDSDNYTFKQATFKDSLTINKRTAEISNINIENMVYGSKDAIYVTGDISRTPYASNYTGTITVTINGVKGQANACDGKFNVTVNGIGRFNTGTYNVTVEGKETANYNEILKNEDAKLEITKTNIAINDINIRKVVYGKDLTATVYGSVKSNVMIEDVTYTGEVTVTVKDKNITNKSHVLSNGDFTVNLDLGILPASKYTLIVTIVGDENYKTAQKEFGDIMTVVKDNATVLLDELHVEYGMQDSITLNGSISKSGHGVCWNGRIDVNIGNHTYRNITVDNGTFQVSVEDISSFKAGKYDICIIDVEGNENYTLNKTTVFKNHLTINKKTVNVSLDNIIITYGDYPYVEVDGHVSSSPYGAEYSGKINATIGNHTYKNINVVNGHFTVNITDIAEYDTGNYTIIIQESEDNDNYTFKQATFKDSLTINKRTAEISNINIENMVYGSKDAIYVTGDISRTPYASNYTGTITVTINGVKGQANACDGKFNVTVNGIGRFNTGTYNVTVEGKETANYNEILKNEDAKLEITKTNIAINDINIRKVVYGKDLTATVYGSVKSNVMIEDVTYTGEVTVTVKDKNITNKSHVLSNGDFTVNLDLGILPASKYTLIVTIVGDENYKTAQKEFGDIMTVVKDNATVLLDELHVEYGMQDSITLNGSISKSGHGVCWNGRIDVNIGNHTYRNITVDNGTFQVSVEDISSFKAGKYDICIIDVEGNENYTLNKTTVFKNHLTINKKTVNVSLDNIIITYGDYPYVEVDGHVSSSPYGAEYSGKINATIGNHTYKNINVVNGHFTVNITDIAEYDTGNYTIIIQESEDNDNYTFKQATFKDDLTINKRTAEISNINIKNIVYASTDTIHITGDITPTPYASNYTGLITVTINDLKCQANARNGKFNVTVNGVKKLNADKYNVSINGEETVNYRVCGENASFEVVKANCRMETSITNVKIDQNATVSVILPNDATGHVIVIFNNTEYAIDLANTRSIVLPIAPAGTHRVIISYDGDDNYNPAETQIKSFTVYKYNASDLQNEINQAIANNQTELNLTHDYEFGENETTPVTVNGSIKINGNNHIVDANNSSGIFNITGDDVTLNNMTLINSNGIAIQSNGTNTTITNSNLENNNGTVIKIDGDNSKLNNNIISGNNGVGIEVNGEHANLTDNEILNNIGHGIVINGGGAKISNITFANNTGEAGASILINGTNTTVTNSTFKNNTAVNGSDIMITENANMTQDEINNLTKDNEINPADIIQTPTMAVHMPENTIYSDDNITITVILTDKNGKVRISIPNLKETDELTVIEGVINLELKNIPAGKYCATFKYIPSKGYAQIPEITRELIVKNHSFRELQELINEAKDNNQSEINLKHDYIFQDGDEAIKIPDNMKIKGNGFTIDGNGKSGIFNITGDNVTISDITLTHANASEGGAILWNGNNGTLQKAILKENHAVNGSAVLWNGNDGRIIDTVFENNTAKESGAGAVLNGDNIIVDNSTFKNNKAETGAGILANGENIKITNSQFLNNTANDGINNILVKQNATINVDDNTRKASDSQIDVKITELTVTSLTVNNTGVSISVKLNVPTGNVYANINGNRHYAKVTDGVATINILNLANGEYNADIIYPATESYTSAITNARFTIYKITTKIIGETDTNVYYLQGSKTTIRLIDNKGNPVSNANILFIVDGKEYNRNTDANGYATLKLNLSPGNHELYVSSDNDLITNKIIVKHIVNAKKTTTVKKSAKKTSITITVKGHNVKQTVDIKFTYNGANKIKASFGKDMKKQTVTVKFKGKTYKVKVDAKGKGILKLNKKLKKGKKYTAKVTYNGPKLYKNVKVTVKFNGKKYTVKTNKQGVGKFKVTKKMVKKLKKGKKVKYTIKYKADKLNRYVKIK